MSMRVPGSAHQPPAASPDPVVEAVRADLLARSVVGLAKYGTTLAANDLPMRDRLQHLYEELLDGANYCKWLMMKIDAGRGS